MKRCPFVKSGFTLVEIMVVIGVIGVLATGGLLAYDDARKQARDVKRIEDLRMIAETLQLYDRENASLPFDCASGVKIEGDFDATTNETFKCTDNGKIEGALNKYLNTDDALHDPLGPGDDRYFYYYDNHACAPHVATGPNNTREVIVFAAMEKPENSNREEVCGAVGVTATMASGTNNDGFYNYNTIVAQENFPYVVSLKIY